MVPNKNIEALAKIDKYVKKIDKYVKNLGIIEWQIVRDHVMIPNTPDCSAEIIGLMFKYGEAYKKTVDGIESLRKEIDCTNYDWLQYQLRKKIYTSDEMAGFIKSDDYFNRIHFGKLEAKKR